MSEVLNDKEIDSILKAVNEADSVKIHFKKNDTVNHPDHYNFAGVECFDLLLTTQGETATAGFCLCNAMKYLYRHRAKNELEDVRKAYWYLGKFIEICEKNGGNDESDT